VVSAAGNEGPVCMAFGTRHPGMAGVFCAPAEWGRGKVSLVADGSKRWLKPEGEE